MCESKEKKINEHGAGLWISILYTECFAYNRSEEKSALAERTECQAVQRVTNVAQSGAILRVAPKYELCFKAAVKKWSSAVEQWTAEVTREYL